jgi:PIN domain nuclease of toxin-antitoxin system
MRWLLDTHVWLWLQVSPERLSGDTLALLGDVENEILLSSASCWEIAIKHGLGKIALPAAPSVYVPSRMAQSGTLPLPVLPAHALRVAELPPHHRDPFDRLLIAQAQHERLPLVSADPALRPYDVELRAP